MPVIGVLYGVSAAEWTEHMAAFRRGLTEIGFVAGRNVAIEYRWAEGHYDRMAWMAVDLVGRRIAVMLIGGNTTAGRAMISAAGPIPIVFTTRPRCGWPCYQPQPARRQCDRVHEFQQ